MWGSQKYGNCLIEMALVTYWILYRAEEAMLGARAEGLQYNQIPLQRVVIGP